MLYTGGGRRRFKFSNGQLLLDFSLTDKHYDSII